MNKELRKYWVSEGQIQTGVETKISLKDWYLTTSHIPEQINPNHYSIKIIRLPKNVAQYYIFLNVYVDSVT